MRRKASEGLWRDGAQDFRAVWQASGAQHGVSPKSKGPGKNGELAKLDLKVLLTDMDWAENLILQLSHLAIGAKGPSRLRSIFQLVRSKTRPRTFRVLVMFAVSCLDALLWRCDLAGAPRSLLRSCEALRPPKPVEKGEAACFGVPVTWQFILIYFAA